MRVGYYHQGTVGKAEVVKAIAAAGHQVFQRSADYFKESEKAFDAVIVDMKEQAVKTGALEGYLKAYAGKPVVTVEAFMKDGKLGGGEKEKQTPAKPEPQPEKEPAKQEPEKEPEKQPEPEKKPFNPDEPSKVRGKRKQG